jgi:non-canonical purine NTP pyrophosphatase (RdgB/HAM1 family)
MNLLVATSNPGKAKEFREMLGTDRYVWISLSDLPDIPPVEETGRTFRDNACLKASYYAVQANAARPGTWVLADDSGLEVDALGGKPGVHSARWAELHNAGRGDVANNLLLLKQLAHVDDELRTARFVCTLALANPQGNIVLTTRDTVEGRILHHPRGENGFGYDPLFLIDELQQTTAELSPSDKHRISHRGKALRHLRSMMDQVLQLT